MVQFNDFKDLYSKELAFHGFGHALFHPIAGSDMKPPCCGYFDRSGGWNLIAQLTPHAPTAHHEGYTPLPYLPRPEGQVDIVWRSKTSLGTEAKTIDGSLQTPSNVPAGLDSHVKYQSDKKFGAVLLTQKPVRLTAYNDEGLFVDWLAANRKFLYQHHGDELKQYGFWVVTRTYTAPGCSINAWIKSKEAAVVSMKMKAHMLGELGEDLSWQDMLNDGGWSHYKAKDEEGLVVFLDGIHTSPWEWKLEGFRQGLPMFPRRQNPPKKRLRPSDSPRIQLRDAEEELKQTHPPVEATPPIKPRYRSAPRDRPISWSSAPGDVDDDALRDLGLKHSLSRSSSTRTAGSLVRGMNGHVNGKSSPSLRRETRQVS